MLQSAALNDNDAVGQILIFITKINWNFWQSQILVKCFSVTEPYPKPKRVAGKKLMST